MTITTITTATTITSTAGMKYAGMTTTIIETGTATIEMLRAIDMTAIAIAGMIGLAGGMIERISDELRAVLAAYPKARRPVRFPMDGNALTEKV